MPVNVGDTHGNCALPVPRASTDGSSTISVAPSTVQGASPQSWATTDSTVLGEGDKEAQSSAYASFVVNSSRMFKDALRSEVELELATARQKIMTIQRDIDTCRGRPRGRSNETAAGPKRKFTGQPLIPPSTWKEEGAEKDDFHSAMYHANGAIRTLLHLSRQHEHPSAPSPSTSPSTSTLPNLATATDAELNRARVEAMNKLIGTLQRNLRVRYELEIGEVVRAVLPSLADKATKQSRATAYRLLRHSLVDAHSVRRLGEQNLDWFIVKSLSRDNKHTVEKEQAVKLIRAVVEIGSERHSPNSAVGTGTVPLSDAVMRAVISVAEYPEDPFKPICLQTLTEILLIDIDLMARTGGIRVLLHSLAEGPIEMAPLLSAAFLHIIDSPRTRAYLRPGTDLEIALSGITDAYGKGVEHSERVKGCARIVTSMLRTWSGLMYFCINDKMAIKAVIDCLRIPSLETREVILDMFFVILNIKPPEWHQAFIDGRRLTTAKIQALPRVFKLASDYDDNEHRIIGSSALSAIDSFNRHRARLEPAVKGDSGRPRANSVEDAVRRGQRAVEQEKMKMRMQMDDKTFQAFLLDTQVMLTKDHGKWNFDTLQELVEGPLHNPKRMEEAIKVSRYIRKLMSFFHPMAHRFSSLPKTKQNVRWVRLGCSLLNALLASQDGVKFLAEDEFLSQLYKSFDQLDPQTPTPTSDPVFSKKRMQDTLTYGYFEMLGTLSRRKEGIELLEKFKLFSAFYLLTELRGREDLVIGIIENLDLSIDGHSRIVLSKALTSNYPHVRRYATQRLGTLIRSSTTASAWTLRLLLTQLYDPSMEVREMAVQFLEGACESQDVLQMVVEMQPTLDHLGEVGHPLLLKFMSTPTGFRYLYAAEYIEREMELWFHERNLHYVVHIEVFLAKAFSQNATEDEDDILAFDGIVPPHFYGVMAKTDLGCEVLQEKGHFAEFAHFIRQHGSESEDQDLILKLKSILWAVGNIGATERGLPFLEDEEIIPAILEIAEQSLVLSVRGTCFFVLGLISSTPQGAEILDDYHWEATLSPLGLPTGLCVPVDVDKFVSVPEWECVAVEAMDDSKLAAPESPEEMEVMTAIYNLANTVIANAASRTLTKMKSKPEYRHIFTSPSMFYRALHTISSQKYRMPVRRYIFDLFNIELDADVVKQLSDCAISLRIPLVAQGQEAAETVDTSPVQEKPRQTVVQTFRPRPTRHHVSESEDEESDVEEKEVTAKKPRAPVMSLRPKSRIIGFN
uniref:Guanyl nucleotide exchange factor Sql2 n=1 Tax=Ganoderma boninense TaxID=34458 RepID=A0A5K1K4T8_9APHY|nr:Guanyl nucleotide exchange factor Sql2 [Ganoderma boninense]